MSSPSRCHRGCRERSAGDGRHSADASPQLRSRVWGGFVPPVGDRLARHHRLGERRAVARARAAHLRVGDRAGGTRLPARRRAGGAARRGSGRSALARRRVVDRPRYLIALVSGCGGRPGHPRSRVIKTGFDGSRARAGVRRPGPSARSPRGLDTVRQHRKSLRASLHGRDRSAVRRRGASPCSRLRVAQRWGSDKFRV